MIRGLAAAVATPLAVLLAGALAVTTAAGCGGAPLPPSPPPTDLTVELGGADDLGNGFLPLAGDVHLVPGGQGGFHFWVKYRLTGVASGAYRLAYTARRITGGALVLLGERSVDIEAPADGGAWESPVPIPAFMCPSPVGVEVRDQAIRLELRVTDPAGTQDLGGAQVEVTPRCPADDLGVYCASICSG